MKMDQNKIKRQAKQILDKFAKALSKVDDKEVDFYIDREDFERVEKSEKNRKVCKDKDFKKNFLKNALQHNDDFIITERGSWK